MSAPSTRSAPTVRSSSRSRLSRLASRVGWAHRWPHLVLAPLALLWLMPVFMVLGLSLLPTNNPRTTFLNMLPETPSLSNYVEIWSQNPILQHVVNSMIITVPTVILVVLFGSLAAFGFAVLRIPFKTFWFLVLVLALVLPIPAVVVALFQVLQALGLYNQLGGLILAYSALGIPFATIIFRVSFKAIPGAMYEAAELDGASRWRIFLRIYLPLAKPAAAVVVIWQFMITWNEFLLPLVAIVDNSKKPLTLVPLAYQGIYLSQPGALFAILVLISVPVVVVFLATQRFLVAGLSGAVK